MLWINQANWFVENVEIKQKTHKIPLLTVDNYVDNVDI